MDMEKRLTRVERQCRWYRNLFVMAGVMLVALVSFGAESESLEKRIAIVERKQLDTSIELERLLLRLYSGTLDVIRARKFEVVDAEGKAVVVMESWKLGVRWK